MSSLSVLIIDDASMFGKSARNFLLRYQGIKAVELAADIEEAQGKVCSMRPEVIFLNRELLEKDGYSFCRMLKKKFPGAKIIVLNIFQEEGDFLLPWLNREEVCLDGAIAKENFGASCLPLLISLFPDFVLDRPEE